MSENHRALLAVAAADEVQQGDIFRIIQSLDDLSTDEDANWCLILTADCDIAQNKLDSCFTVLTIVTASAWLETVWADEKVDQALTKGLNDLSTRIWNHEKKRDPAVARFSRAEARRFVDESSVDNIDRAFGSDERTGQWIKKQVSALKDLAIGQVTNQKLAAWIGWRRFLEMSDKAIASDIRDAFSNMRGGYFFLPELPGQSHIGHVVLLREIRAAPLESVFRRAIDIRSTTTPPPFFLRIGRLSDNVRYAIAQQVATLFSRVGLPASFESECEAAKDTASEEILKRLELTSV